MDTRNRQLSAETGIAVLLALLLLLYGGGAFAAADPKQSADLTEKSIEELMNIEVKSSATLTETKPRLVPAAVTTITREDIQLSGARSLYELLDIYVPNLEWERQHWENDQMGLRGIIADRNGKYLILVNGRNMNEHTHFGALTEQDQVLLTDIDHIDVIRGPGSALYGPGAVSMVINIITLNANTFQGTEITTRLGAIEEFYTGEVRHGQKFDDNDGGIFLYGGIGNYIGASKYDAPEIYPFTFPTTGGSAPSSFDVPGQGTRAGHPMTNTNVNRDEAAACDMPPVKVHVGITKDDWDIWARFTRGGKEYSWATGSIARSPYGWGDWAWYSKYTGAGTTPPEPKPNFYSYEQLTGYIGRKQELTKTLGLDYAFSYMTTSVAEAREVRPVDDYREDNYYARTLLNWQPNDQHKVAFGAELTHLDLGLPAFDGLGYSLPYRRGAAIVKHPIDQSWAYNVVMPRWSTNMWSLLGEHQWNINDQWTTFLGGRLDDHTYAEKMFSPRAAIVHTPNDRDTYKLMWSRSLRANFEEEIKRQYDAGGPPSKPEKFDSIEFRYERRQTKNLDLAASLFVHYNLQVLAWNNSTMESALVGTQREYGLEFEASYHNENTRLTASHGFTKLYGYYLPAGETTYITAKPYGYGNDLTNWSNNITKFTAQQKLNDKWTFDASLHIYWGFPGLKDFEDYSPYASGKTGNIVADEWERTFRGSYFLDLGLQYKPTKDLTIGINGYNLLGIFNIDLNKRNYVEPGGAAGSDFRSAAPAVGVSLSYKF
jgi:outer membrane receptor protein involved in Fe transport